MGKKISNSAFIEKANKIHKGKYDYSLTKYKNRRTNITIICNHHNKPHHFKQRPDNHLRGSGCTKCIEYVSGYTTDLFITNAKLIHKNRYDYSLTNYKNMKTKITIICHSHTEPYHFNQRPDSHLIGTGCNRCIKRVSKKETKWLDSIKEVIIRQYRLPETNLIVDGFNEATNTVYEFHGDYWHGNPKVFDPKLKNNTNGKLFSELYRLTILKEKKIRELGYKLISMWEYDFETIQINNIRDKKML